MSQQNNGGWQSEIQAPDFDELLDYGAQTTGDPFAVEDLGIAFDVGLVKQARVLLDDQNICGTSSVEAMTDAVFALMEIGLDPETAAGLLWERGIPAEHQVREVICVVENKYDERGYFGSEGRYQQVGPSETRSVLMFIVWGRDGRANNGGVVWKF